MMHAVAIRWGKLVLGGLFGILALGAAVVGVVLLDQHKQAHAEAGVAKAAVTASSAARPTRVGPDSLILPLEVVRSLDVRTAAVASQCRPRSLPPFAGTLALENDRLARARTRFAGEVIALGTPGDGETTQLASAGSAAERALAVGDRVTRGQLLAVVWSKDLGEKKSELVDAVSKLKLHREVRDKLRKLYTEGGTSERGVREAEQQVESDLIAVAKAEQTLRAWQLTDGQLNAIRAIQDGNSVIVSAPTGSGKTLVAEFAIHATLARQRRIAYTPPLKALSNQKYADFCRQFGMAEGGILTGDVKVTPRASVLVMTTEILRNMFYTGTLEGLRHVVLDECHYMGDESRGTVWEEIIVNAPKDVTLVALSATVANVSEIADWIGLVHRPIRAVVHPHRPVPLRYHVADLAA